jgi:hypothetical protein
MCLSGESSCHLTQLIQLRTRAAEVAELRRLTRMMDDDWGYPYFRTPLKKKMRGGPKVEPLDRSWDQWSLSHIVAASLSSLFFGDFGLDSQVETFPKMVGFPKSSKSLDHFSTERYWNPWWLGDPEALQSSVPETWQLLDGPWRWLHRRNLSLSLRMYPLAI